MVININYPLSHIQTIKANKQTNTQHTLKFYINIYVCKYACFTSYIQMDDGCLDEWMDGLMVGWMEGWIFCRWNERTSIICTIFL